MVRKTIRYFTAGPFLRNAKLGLLVLAVLVVNVACSSLLYYPRENRGFFYDPKKFGLSQEEVVFRGKDGLELHGWWFAASAQPAKGTLVFFHGNAENISTHFLNFSWLPEKGYNYFIFDYPDYGKSTGQPSPESTVQAGQAALAWVHENKDKGPLFVYGQSLGGNIAFRAVLDVKDRIPIRALILDGTFLSYRSIARQKASESYLLWLLQPIAWLAMSDRYAPADIEKRVPIPLLVIHGQKDKVIDPKFGEEIFAKSPEPKEIWRIEEGQHGDTFFAHQKQYRQKLLDFMMKQ